MAVAYQYQVISNSKAKTWRRCPKQFAFKYIDGYKPKERVIQLERGSWMHELLEHHYDGEDWRELHAFKSKLFYEMFEEEREHLGDLPVECEHLMTGYLFHWRKEDKLYTIVDTELDEVVGLPNGLKIRVIIDKVIEDRSGGLWIVDYKTGKNMLDPDWMTLDPQLGRYHWCAEYLGYTPLRGVMYDEIRTKAPTLPKLTTNGTRLEMRKNLQCDVYTYFKELKRHGLDVKPHAKFIRHLQSQTESWFRRTPLAKDQYLTKQLIRETVMTAREIKTAEELGQFPRTPTKDCKWDCAFKNPCIIQLQGGNIDPIMKMNFTSREAIDEHNENTRR